jgi:hypothetical protein
MWKRLRHNGIALKILCQILSSIWHGRLITADVRPHKVLNIHTKYLIWCTTVSKPDSLKVSRRPYKHIRWLTSAENWISNYWPMIARIYSSPVSSANGIAATATSNQGQFIAPTINASVRPCFLVFIHHLVFPSVYLAQYAIFFFASASGDAEVLTLQFNIHYLNLPVGQSNESGFDCSSQSHPNRHSLWGSGDYPS